jgi:hypothetical protein
MEREKNGTSGRSHKLGRTRAERVYNIFDKKIY